MTKNTQETTYNSWKNHATWEAKLLDNTSLEVYNEFEALKAKYREVMREYKEYEAQHASGTLSYPFHQVSAIEKELKKLIDKTGYAGSKSDIYLLEILATE